ncbi:sugar-binding transcriptional regulator [Mycolicibacterium thermoresistibile]|nr:sugar-binding domain-containing protein [Mycolicibacterium thermoresistibile]MCV7191171.1 MarR family transcriptional regulator [Mycolicibacterium thermoresistibile]GAT15477.1 transcriptional regulator with sigma factor-related N-terminal domain [Mycolicibacterium thermoresistibile]SNW16972.1 transcriptional regulator with sigma factor-related N-terminal domain [Mycolicibacterium thermoresistibile]
MSGPTMDSPEPSAPAAAEDLRLALRAASLYYLDNLTQAEVAARLGVSRPTAGRLIARAKAKGLVRIEVVVPPDQRDSVYADEEMDLEAAFGLIEAVVVGGNLDDAGPLDDPATWAPVGRAGARLLTRRLRPTDSLGFNWGPEVVAVAKALPAGAASCRAVVQLDGAISAGNYQTGTEYVLGRCAERLHAKVIRLPAPLYADPATVASLHNDSLISRALEAGRSAEVMMFGVGTVSTSTTLFEGSFLDTGMLDRLKAQGAVGEIGGRFFDADGVVLETELSPRAVSVPLEDIRDCPTTILLTGGSGKYEAALAALRGGFARYLVCDVHCARWLLDNRKEVPR